MDNRQNENKSQNNPRFERRQNMNSESKNYNQRKFQRDGTNAGPRPSIQNNSSRQQNQFRQSYPSQRNSENSGSNMNFVPKRFPPRQNFAGPSSRTDGRISNESRANGRVSDEELNSYFGNSQSYNKNPNWTLPSISKIYTSPIYEEQKFQEIKEKMNNEKDKILENYSVEHWKEIKDKHALNPKIVKVLKMTLKCGNVTRNWCKLYEILKTFPLVKSGKINSVHIGDQHGGMITALNHYIHCNFEEVEWNWKAMCINPYYEGENYDNRSDDRLICHTYDNWTFGMDFSGNVIDPENISFFAKKCHEMGEIDLAICTQTTDTKLDPNNRENLKFDSHFAGMIAGLNALSNGGNLIMLSSTLFNFVNISIMYFLNMVFHKVILYKPSCTPVSSSEIFVIGLSFKKDRNIEEYIEIMQTKVGPKSYEKGSLFGKEEIPSDFISQHYAFMEYFSKKYLENTKKIKFYEENPEDGHTKRWEIICRIMPKFFISKYDIKDISEEKKLIQFDNGLNIKFCSNMSKLTIDYKFSKDENCNFTTEILKCFDENDFTDQLMLIFEKFKATQELVYWPYCTEDKTLTNLKPIDLILEYGKPIERVRKTLFITPSIMYMFVNKIEDNFNIFIVESFKDEIECIFDEKIKIKYKFKTNYGDSERDFLKVVLNEWIAKKPKKIEFKNLLFITHFSASFLRILAVYYKYLTVNLKGYVEMEGFKEKVDLNLIKEFQSKISGGSWDYVMCFTEYKQVNKGEYFEILSNYNSQLLMQYIVKTFDDLISKAL